MMRTLVAALCFLLLPASAAKAQQRYSATFYKASAGNLMNLQHALWSAGGGTVLKHAQGDDWDFVRVEGKGCGPAAHSVPAALEDARRTVALTGPDCDALRRVLAEGEGLIYIVADYRARAGQRKQMLAALERVVSTGRAGHDVIFSADPGSAFDYLLITRYDSWSQLAEEETHSAQSTHHVQQHGFAGPDDLGEELRRYAAGHHDTICRRVR